jgi:hypothetical protein
MFEILKLLNTSVDLSAVAIVGLRRSGALLTEVKPGSTRHRQLVELRAALAVVVMPVRAGDVGVWLEQIIAGTKGGQMAAEEVGERGGSIKFALEGGKPACLIGAGLQRAVLLDDTRLPKAVSVRAVMAPYARAFETLLQDLNRLLGRMVLVLSADSAAISLHGTCWARIRVNVSSTSRPIFCMS